MVRGFLLGVLTTMLFLSNTSISHEAIKSFAHVEKLINSWVKTKHCETAVVKEIDILDRKVLVKARGIYFVLTAHDSDNFEICPIATNSIPKR